MNKKMEKWLIEEGQNSKTLGYIIERNTRSQVIRLASFFGLANLVALSGLIVATFYKIDSITESSIDAAVRRIVENTQVEQKVAGRIIDTYESTPPQFIEEIVDNKTSELEQKLTQATPKIIAVLRVVGRKIEYSSKGVTYNESNGEIEFPNPENLRILPIITRHHQSDYDTRTTYIRYINGPNKIQLRETALDTRKNGWDPESFTAVIVGL